MHDEDDDSTMSMMMAVTIIIIQSTIQGRHSICNVGLSDVNAGAGCDQSSARFVGGWGSIPSGAFQPPPSFHRLPTGLVKIS